MDTLKKLISLLAILFIAYQVSYAIWFSYNMPIYETDAIGVHAYKAKAFFYDHTMQKQSWIAKSYPPLVPLMMASVAMLIGQWNEGIVKIIYPLHLIGFLCVTFFFIKSLRDSFTALLGVALMCSSIYFIQQVSVAQTDFIFMTYTMTSLMMLYRSRMLLAGLFMALACMTKSVGIAYFGIGLTLALLYRTRGTLLYVLPFIALEAIWFMVKHHLGVKDYWVTYFFSMPRDVMHRLPMMWHSLTQCLFLSGRWMLLWWILPFAFLLGRRGKEITFFSTALALGFSYYLLCCLFTAKFNTIAGLPSTQHLPRFLLHFYPLCPLLITLLIKDIRLASMVIAITVIAVSFQLVKQTNLWRGATHFVKMGVFNRERKFCEYLKQTIPFGEKCHINAGNDVIRYLAYPNVQIVPRDNRPLSCNIYFVR